MNRIQRGISAAIQAAGLSVEKHKVGAAIYLGRRLVSIGWNSNKTYPKCTGFHRWQHAEVAALIGTSKFNLVNATIYVARITRSGLVSMAMPCEDCQEFLRAVGVRRAVYTDYNGQPKRMKLNHKA